MAITPMISECGEKFLVSQITNMLDVDEKLIGGFGHDSAFLDITINEDEVLLLNTDRSGMNLAYSLNLANAQCVGDFGISHAFSDILVSGGTPIAASVALLLPDNMTLDFVKDVMKGAQKAAQKYGAFLASGDTKKNPKFAMVVTALGKCKKNRIITRKGAKAGDLIVSTGHFGTMMSGYLAFKNSIEISSTMHDLFCQALIYQNPPYKIASRMSDEKIVNAGIDNSDGLSSSIYSLCNLNKLGAIIYKDRIPIREESKIIAKKLGLDDFGLCLSSGDWQFIYSIAEENIETFMKIAHENDTKATIIGEFTNNPDILLKIKDSYYIMPKIENDRFSSSGLFEKLSGNIDYMGKEVKI